MGGEQRALFRAPLSSERADGLVRAARVAPGRHVLDLACGNGELLLRAIAAYSATTGTGVDADPDALDRARRAAIERRLTERVEFVEADPAMFEDLGSLVIALTAGAVWGSPETWIEAVKARLEPGGLALVGDRVLLGGAPDLSALAERHGFRVLLVEEATQAELDASAPSGVPVPAGAGYGYLLLSPTGSSGSLVATTRRPSRS